jgi:imidazolonepropionase-like amidohydrolase
MRRDGVNSSPTGRRNVATAVVASLWIWGSGASKAETAPIPAGVTYAITHATVIDPVGGAHEYPDTTLVISDDRILSVGPSASTPIPDGAGVRDASGRFVIPGLWDAHVHLSQVGQNALPLLISNGVTSVRDMGSDFEQILRWKADRAAGAPIPRILAPGPKLYGGSLIERLGVRFTKWKHEIRVVTSADDARRAVDELKTRGVDFIKVHNHLTPELYDAIAAESHKVNLEFAGHLPVAGPLAAAAAGQRTIEHGRGMLLCSPELWARIRSEAPADAQFCAPLEIQARLFPALVEAGIWLTPTLTSWRGNAMVGDPGLAARIEVLPGSSTIWPSLRSHWDDMAGSTPTVLEHELIAQFADLAAAASRAGVPLLAGTDLGDPYVIPGFSLHDELALMVKAGVTTLQALQSATSEPARAFGLTATVGAVKAGQAADLLVLDADPLIDIDNTRRIHAVVLNGRWINP